MTGPRWGNARSAEAAPNQVLLDVDRESGIAWVTLNRPEKHNALSVPMRDRITDLIDSLNDDDAVRVIVFRGNGPSFCSGNEINEDWGQRGSDYRRYTVTHAYRYSSELAWGRQSFSQAIARSPKITISQVHGYCAAAAYFLVASKTDLVVVSDDAKIGALEARFLGPASSVASIHLNRIIGTKAARMSGFTGAAMDAQRAFDYGLACHVSRSAELTADTDRLAASIAARPRETLNHLKGRIKGGDSHMHANVPVISGLLASHFLRSHEDEHSFWKSVSKEGVAGALREDKRRAAASAGNEGGTP